MITIDGVNLDDRYAWILNEKQNKQVRVATGVIFLVSIQNTQKQFSAWKKMIRKLNPLPERVIFCENDSTDNTLSLIRNWDFPHEVLSFKSKESDIKKDPYSVIAKNRQKLLESARSFKPKFAIFLDDDVFPDNPDIITKITEHNLAIVGGAYLRPFDNKGLHLASKWHVDSIRNMPTKKGLEEVVASLKKQGFDYVIFNSCERKLYEVDLTSAGCLCLRADVIQDTRLHFYPMSHGLAKSEKVSEDFSFCLLAKSLGYKIYLDGAIQLAHLINPEKHRPWIIK